MSEDKKRPEDIDSMQAYAHWLNSVHGVGNKAIDLLLSKLGTAKAVFDTKENQLSPLIGEKLALNIQQEKGRNVGDEYEKLSRQGISFYPYYHKAYPEKLLKIPDRPFGIYVKGKLPDSTKRSVAIVGARDCSGYGEYVAEKFARELSQNDIQIISGMARGVDGIAGQAALACGGESFAVLGCGADICYPSSHRKLYQDLCERGGIISSYLPGTKPSPGLFPPRNRIISGLSDVVLVIEARQKSGTLITVDMALEQGREVYVIPGRITDRLSDGCNSLLLQGAGAAITPRQFIRDLTETVWSKFQYNSGKGETTQQADKTRQICKTQLTENLLQLGGEERELLKMMETELTTLEQIFTKVQSCKQLKMLSLPVVMELLVDLSIKGFIHCEGGYYRRSGQLLMEDK